MGAAVLLLVSAYRVIVANNSQLVYHVRVRDTTALALSPHICTLLSLNRLQSPTKWPVMDQIRCLGLSKGT